MKQKLTFPRKITFQEDLIEELNKTVYQQQQKLDRLEAVCESLARHIQSLSEARNEEMPVNERPPHYQRISMADVVACIAASTLKNSTFPHTP